MYSVDTAESIIRSILGENSTEYLSSERVLQAVNDGYLDVASRTGCIEKIETLNTIAGERLLRPITSYKVNAITLVSGAPSVSLLKTTPGVLGWTSAELTSTEEITVSIVNWVDKSRVTWNSVFKDKGAAITRMVLHGIPKYWFNWGPYIVLDPVPDFAYSLLVHYSDYPSQAMFQNLVIFQDTEDVVFGDGEVEWQKELSNDLTREVPEAFQSCIIYFSLYVLSMYLKKWNKAGKFYNEYVANLIHQKKQYLLAKAEKRLAV